MESEILFASLSREPGFPITVPATQFADYHRGTGTGILISEQIHFGAYGIERQYHKCLDYEMPAWLLDAPALIRSRFGEAARTLSRKDTRIKEDESVRAPLQMLTNALNLWETRHFGDLLDAALA
jgi:hypothetical protein